MGGIEWTNNCAGAGAGAGDGDGDGEGGNTRWDSGCCGELGVLLLSVIVTLRVNLLTTSSHQKIRGEMIEEDTSKPSFSDVKPRFWPEFKRGIDFN